MSSIAHIKGTLIKIVSCTTINHAQYLTSIASNEPAEQIAQKAVSRPSVYGMMFIVAVMPYPRVYQGVGWLV